MHNESLDSSSVSSELTITNLSVDGSLVNKDILATVGGRDETICPCPNIVHIQRERDIQTSERSLFVNTHVVHVCIVHIVVCISVVPMYDLLSVREGHVQPFLTLNHLTVPVTLAIL
jgi:hypothetical protein